MIVRFFSGIIVRLYKHRNTCWSYGYYSLIAIIVEINGWGSWEFFWGSMNWDCSIYPGVIGRKIPEIK